MHWGLVTSLCFWLLALFTPDLLAASPTVFRLSSQGICPLAEQVETELLPLLHRHAVTSVETETHEVIEIIDLGSSYEVRALGVTREIPDATRDCEGRARIAAVVVALTIEPAGGNEDPPPAPEDPQIPEEPVSDEKTSDEADEADRLNAPPAWEVALGVKSSATFEGYGPDVGPSIGVNFLHGRWLIAASGSFFSVQRIDLEDATATFSRYTLDLTVGPVVEVAAWQFRGTAGVAFDPLVIAAEAFESRQVRFDLGPTAALSLAYRGGRVDPFLLFDARWFPRDYQLWVEPRGEVGRTPQLYLGAAAGIRIDQF